VTACHTLIAATTVPMPTATEAKIVECSRMKLNIGTMTSAAALTAFWMLPNATTALAMAPGASFAIQAARRVRSGRYLMARSRKASPKTSFRWAMAPLNPPPAAFAAPPNSVFSSFRMSFCAPIVSPLLTIAAIWSFCAAVNDTPTRCRAVTPLMGSFSALPTWMVEPCRSVPSAVDRFRAAFVPWVKMSLPLPASLRTLVNVASTFWLLMMSSSSTPDIVSSVLARASICLTDVPATLPVDFRTAADFSCSDW
jgi:hypothetical protein